MRKNGLVIAGGLAVALLHLAPTATRAQSQGTLPRVLELPASTRAMALGNAYMLNARHADALFYHPSLVVAASGFGVDVQRWGDEGSSASASAAMRWLGGGIAIGLQTMQFGGRSSAPAAAPAGQDHLFESGDTPVSERVVSLGYARSFGGVSIGAAVKLAEERVGDLRDDGAYFDVGISTDVGPLTAALTYRNAGSQLAVDGAANRPDVLSFGIGGYGTPLGPLDVGVTASIDYAGEEVIPAGGLEFGYWPVRGRTFVARVGARRVMEGDASPLSFGFAYWGDVVTLEWAFQPVDVSGASGTHRFGLRWREGGRFF